MRTAQFLAGLALAALVATVACEFQRLHARERNLAELQQRSPECVAEGVRF